jgi:hypothetical protein
LQGLTLNTNENFNHNFSEEKMPYAPAQKVVINNAPIAVLAKLNGAAVSVVATLNNVQAQLKMLISPSEAAGGENVDITQPDGAILRFPKINKIMSGVDDSDITPAGSSSTATGYGEIVLTVNEAPEEFTSMTNFLKYIHDEKDSKFLIIIPTGFTYKGQVVDATKKTDGWAYMIGKRTSDIDITFDANHKQLPITFASNSDGTVTSANLTALTMPAIPVRSIGASITPPAIVSGDVTDITTGKVRIKPTTYA